MYKQKLIKKFNGIPVSIETEDKLALSGLLFLRPHAPYNLLVCHGWCIHKERLRKLIKMFPHANILLFDFRAHGESAGDFSSIGYFERSDVVAAFKYLQNHEHTKELPIFGIGFSMGAASLLGAAAQGLPFSGLILDSIFGRLDELIHGTFTFQTGLPSFPLFNLCKSWYEYLCNCRMDDINPAEWARLVSIPIFIIHSQEDHLVHPSAVQQLYENVKSAFRLMKSQKHLNYFKYAYRRQKIKDIINIKKSNKEKKLKKYKSE